MVAGPAISGSQARRDCLAASRAVARHLARALSPRSPCHFVIERAAAHSYFVSIASLPALDRRSVLGAVDRFLDQGVEGIIVIAPKTSAGHCDGSI